MTIFYVDENLSPTLAHSLSKIFLQHKFLWPQMTGLLSTDDVPLFGDLAARDVGCLITLDRQQLKDPEERDGLRAAGLHWLGISGDVDGKGAERIAAHLAMAAPGVAHVLKDWRDRPTAYRCASPGRSVVLEPEEI